MAEGQRNEKFEMMTLHKILFTICALSLTYKYYTVTAPNIVFIKNPKFSTLGPFNTTRITVDDNYNQLIDISNFTFNINPQPCKDYPAGVLLIIIISSKSNNFNKRMAIRKTWGRNHDSTKVLFLIGESDWFIKHKVKDESKVYGDIVQGNFEDVYRNMTYKHVMGLKWVAHHCPQAKYVLKTDDDIVVNSLAMTHYLVRELSPWGAKDLIACQLKRKAKVVRSKKNKWYVTTKEYAPKYYPTYCLGWAILYSQDVIPRLLKMVQSLPFFWIDDVHLTGTVAKKIGVHHTSLAKLIFSKRKLEKLKKLGLKSVESLILLGPSDLSARKIMEIWTSISAYV